MSEFDFFTILMAIPLGLAVVEIAQGVSIILRRWERVTIGLLTPLVTIVLLITIIDLWIQLWGLQDQVAITRPFLFGGLFAALEFYVSASFIFPESIDEGIDLDEWFMRHRKFVLGGTFLVFLILRFAQGNAMPSLGSQENITLAIAYLLGWSSKPGLILVAIFAKRRAFIITALAALIITPFAVLFF